MNKYIREISLWILVLIPYGYLALIWKDLPGQVPTHFGISGKPDDWSGRSALLLLPTAIPLFIYLLTLVLPAFDPKKKLGMMGDKYHSFRFILVLFMSVLSIYLLYVTKAGQIENPQWLLALIGLLVTALGNYFQALRPNYFVGIRTPWTLENEEVWKKTHYLGGRLWIAGGLLIVIASFVVKAFVPLLIIAGSIILVLVMVPVVFSFLEFRRQSAVK